MDRVDDTNIKILVCTNTNVAVDRILLMLLESGFTNFARIGSLKKINKVLLPYSHHNTAKRKKADKDAIKELESMCLDA